MKPFSLSAVDVYTVRSAVVWFPRIFFFGNENKEEEVF